MRVSTAAFLGNFAHPASTENETLRGLRANGIEVEAFQEGDSDVLADLTERIGEFDVCFWTRTRDLAERVGAAPQWKLGQQAAKKGTPLVGVHADLWFGLKRERELDEPYFKMLDLFCTADGAHQDEWAARGMKHCWLLPAVDEQYCYLADPDDAYRSRLAFTGSWEGGYHREANHRHQLVAWLDKHYGDQIVFYPKRGKDRIQRHDLNALVASVDLIVGDSANIDKHGFYCSDRLPTTLGRGGILLHPEVEGVTAPNDPFDAPGLATWGVGDWDSLKWHIDFLLGAEDQSRADQRLTNIEFIKAHHTWTVRAAELLTMVEEECS